MTTRNAFAAGFSGAVRVRTVPVVTNFCEVVPAVSGAATHDESEMCVLWDAISPLLIGLMRLTVGKSPDVSAQPVRGSDPTDARGSDEADESHTAVVQPEWLPSTPANDTFQIWNVLNMERHGGRSGAAHRPQPPALSPHREIEQS